MIGCADIGDKSRHKTLRHGELQRIMNGLSCQSRSLLRSRPLGCGRLLIFTSAALMSMRGAAVPAAASEQPTGPPAVSGTAPASTSQAPASPPTSPMGGMAGMTGEMGQPTLQFYPSLMDMPALTPDARQFIEQEAQQRLSTGTQAITTGETGLHHAMAEKDSTAIQKAAAERRAKIPRRATIGGPRQ